MRSHENKEKTDKRFKIVKESDGFYYLFEKKDKMLFGIKFGEEWRYRDLSYRKENLETVIANIHRAEKDSGEVEYYD